MRNDATVREDVVRFTPSRVEGIDGVSEVVVRPQQVQLQTAERQVTLDLSAVPDEDDAGRAKGLWRFLLSAPRRVVGEIQFNRDRYADSYLRILSDPSVTIYMPSDGPAHYPDSHFWQACATIRRGGYALHDNAHGPRPRPDTFWDDKPVLGRLFAVAALNWIAFAIISSILGGVALRTMPSVEGFILRMNARRVPTTEDLWAFSLFYSTISLVLFPGAAALVVTSALRRMPASQRMLGVPFIAAAALWCWLIVRSAVASYQSWQSMGP
jgi:hypothetical protein